MVMSRFKDALDAVNSGLLRGQDMAEIRLALKIADRVMREPSEGMIKAGFEHRPFCPKDLEHIEIARIQQYFQVMIEQMMREINDSSSI